LFGAGEMRRRVLSPRVCVSPPHGLFDQPGHFSDHVLGSGDLRSRCQRGTRNPCGAKGAVVAVMAGAATMFAAAGSRSRTHFAPQFGPIGVSRFILRDGEAMHLRWKEPFPG
jgi:hypothetical protein